MALTGAERTDGEDDETFQTSRQSRSFLFSLSKGKNKNTHTHISRKGHLNRAEISKKKEKRVGARKMKEGEKKTAVTHNAQFQLCQHREVYISRGDGRVNIKLRSADLLFPPLFFFLYFFLPF